MASVEERRQWLRMMFVLAASDGRVANREKSVIVRACKAWSLGQEDYQWAKGAVEAGQVTLHSPENVEACEILFDSLLKLAAADGRVDDQEFVLVEHYADKLGKSEVELGEVLEQVLDQARAGGVKVEIRQPELKGAERILRLPNAVDHRTVWAANLAMLVRMDGRVSDSVLEWLREYDRKWNVDSELIEKVRGQIMERNALYFGPKFEYEREELEEYYEALCTVAVLSNRVSFAQVDRIGRDIRDLGYSFERIIDRLKTRAREIHGESVPALRVPDDWAARLEAIFSSEKKSQAKRDYRADAALLYGAKFPTRGERVRETIWSVVKFLVIVIKILALISIVAKYS